MDGDPIIYILEYLQPVSRVKCAELGQALWTMGEGSQRCFGIDGNGHFLVWGLSLVDSDTQGIILENILASEHLFSLSSSNSTPPIQGMIDDAHGSMFRLFLSTS